LPSDIQAKVRKAYRLWKNDPGHPSLQFKKIGKVWSARVDDKYRVLAHIVDDTAYWFLVCAHDEYEQVLREFRKK
jgi:hypothetical protein